MDGAYDDPAVQRTIHETIRDEVGCMGWHSWVAGMMSVHPEDVEAVLDARTDGSPLECQRCEIRPCRGCYDPFEPYFGCTCLASCGCPVQVLANEGHQLGCAYREPRSVAPDAHTRTGGSWAERGDDIINESNYHVMLSELRGVAPEPDDPDDDRPTFRDWRRDNSGTLADYKAEMDQERRKDVYLGERRDV